MFEVLVTSIACISNCFLNRSLFLRQTVYYKSVLQSFFNDRLKEYYVSWDWLLVACFFFKSKMFFLTATNTNIPSGWYLLASAQYISLDHCLVSCHAFNSVLVLTWLVMGCAVKLGL